MSKPKLLWSYADIYTTPNFECLAFCFFLNIHAEFHLPRSWQTLVIYYLTVCIVENGNRSSKSCGYLDLGPIAIIPIVELVQDLIN